MRKYLLIALILLVSLVPSVAMAASNTAYATYAGTINVTNSSSAATNVAVPVTGLNIGNLITNNYLWSNATNSAALINGADIVYMPNSAINSTVIFVPSIADSITSSAQLYTGGNQSMNSTLRYFPGAAGMTVADNASLEPAANFQFDVKGYFNTSVSANVISKASAFTLATGSGNITATMYTGGTPSTLTVTATSIASGEHTVRVSADGTNFKIFVDDMVTAKATVSMVIQDAGGHTATKTTASDVVTNIEAVVGAGTHWQAMNSIDDATSYVHDTRFDLVYRQDTYAMSSISPPAGSVITDVSVISRTERNTYASSWATAGIQLGGNTNWGAEHPLSNAWTTYTDSVARPGGGSWALADLNSLYATFKLKSNSGGCDAQGTYIAIQATYSSPITASIPNNANAWTYAASGSMVYVEYMKEYVSAALKGSWAWENAATFTDLSGNGQTATPTFRTTSSNANVSAVLTDFQPLHPSTLSNWVLTTIGNITDTAIDPIPELYTELQGTADLFWGIGGIINLALTAADIPLALFWFPMLYGLTAVIALGTYKLLSGSNRMLGLALELIAEIVFCAFFTFRTNVVLPFWPTLAIFIPQGVAIIEAAREYGI